jgi:VanZ family protein
MGVIALLSSRYFGSAETGSVFEIVARFVLPWAAPERLALLHDTIRKLGHLTEYGILSVLWQRALAESHGRRSAARWAIAIAVVYAGLDELRQGLTPNRTPSVADVALDGLGAGLAALTWRVGHRPGDTLRALARLGLLLGLAACSAAGLLSWLRGLPPWEWLLAAAVGATLGVLDRVSPPPRD